MREQLEQLQADARSRIASVRDIEALERIELELLGRKQGKLTALLRELGRLPTEVRKEIGACANEVRADIERLLQDKRRALERGRMANLTESEWIDVTAPGPRPPAGHFHPIAEAIRDITAIFERIGFIRVRYPEVDSDYYAFESLNMPPDHPARDEWETFFVASATASDRIDRQQTKSRVVLTPHTSNGQVREMEKGILPIRMVNIGKCYRRQVDATHTPMFHQFEGLLVDRDVAVTHLKGTIEHFVRTYFGPERRVRLRPFHFRFTEPSFEVDISCAVCGGSRTRHSPEVEEERGTSDGKTSGVGRRSEERRCKTCKSGWMELAGAGMVHPNVLRAGGIDPDEYSGFAFGFGVERALMMRAGISDIRLLYSNDLRWLQQG